MKHKTHKSWLKWIAGTIATLSIVIGFSFSAAVQATELDITHEVKKSVTCLVFAKVLGLPKSTLSVYYKRIGAAKHHPGAIYQLGYTSGTIDAYGYANSSKFDSYELSRIDAAKHLYKMLGCTINESI